ncbi:unnamed protein product [Dibothriocephalus latus]|uniref:Uncharacterized protein n=1 Tax=Dibothriocephalus latus TaxID=60516 RepID=A0A3P7Q3D3_DIBLA|nr:unnamed protein product [Dibothriocephalus latus]
MMTATDDDDDAELTWVSMGLSPQGLAWSLVSVGRLAASAEEVSSSSGNCVIWCVDTNGQLWMSTGPEFSDEGVPTTPQDGTAPLRWSFVSAPMISHLSCGPDGQVRMHFRTSFAVVCAHCSLSRALSHEEEEEEEEEGASSCTEIYFE